MLKCGVQGSRIQNVAGDNFSLRTNAGLQKCGLTRQTANGMALPFQGFEQAPTDIARRAGEQDAWRRLAHLPPRFKKIHPPDIDLAHDVLARGTHGELRNTILIQVARREYGIAKF